MDSQAIGQPQPKVSAEPSAGATLGTGIAAVLRQHVALLGLAVLVLALGVWHLDRYPRTWFDEGSYLEVSENFAERGLYASESADGSLDYAPVIGVGPSVLLPAAGVVKLAGTDLGAVRLVSVVYLLASTLLLYLISRKLFGRVAAVASAVVLLTLPSLDWIETGRQVLGEVPAVFFLLAGGSVAYRSRSLAQAVVAGALLGLAMTTKGQYLLILPAAIIAVGAIDYLTERRYSARWYLTLLCAAGATYAIWFLTLLSIIGDGNIVENLRLLRQSSGGALLVFNVDRMLAAWKLLLGPSSLFLIAPATIIGAVAWWRADGAHKWALLALLTFQTLWLGWFTTASIAWPRYAFPGIAISMIFIGYLISLLVAQIRDHRAAEPIRHWASAAAMLSVIALLVIVAGWRELSPVVRVDQREPQHFAQIIDRTVPRTAVVDSWEPELTFLSDARIQYPPAGSLDTVVRATWLGSAWNDRLEITPRGEYLVVGPFARWVNAFPEAASTDAYQLIVSEGPYSLYKRVGQADD